MCTCVRACVLQSGCPVAWVCASVCLCARVILLIHHATRMRHIVKSSVASLASPYLSTLSHKRCDFQRKFIEHKMCVLSFSTTFVMNISHFIQNLARYCHKCEKVFMQSTRYSCRILIKLEFSGQIFGKTQISSFVKIRPVGAELFHADRQISRNQQSLFAILRTGLKIAETVRNYVLCTGC
jgi:hypothetical protein